ncbi:hypothetical protein Taro_001721 [Colocasia esculenta]|uniref:Uncharacterized protein n=1 Tax=Colocasia esculenta TaxID=4460 RepID=A0A843TBV6_COLES|nr:hypothetical protein [Colocasia esculenta]
MRTSRDVMSGRSNRPRHRQVLYIPHRHLWTMEYSCKVWCKPCKRRLIPRQHSRLNWMLRKGLMYIGPHYCVPDLRTELSTLLGTSS